MNSLQAANLIGVPQVIAPFSTAMSCSSSVRISRRPTLSKGDVAAARLKRRPVPCRRPSVRRRGPRNPTPAHQAPLRLVGAQCHVRRCEFALALAILTGVIGYASEHGVRQAAEPAPLLLRVGEPHTSAEPRPVCIALNAEGPIWAA
jgi:hypothetical protein